MEKRKLLDKKERAAALKKLPKWKVVRGKLHREFQFDSFAKAFGFMASVALEAESMNHHPEWSNVYGKVQVNLVTHDLDGISTFDIALAEKIDALLRY